MRPGQERAGVQVGSQEQAMEHVYAVSQRRKSEKDVVRPARQRQLFGSNSQAPGRGNKRGGSKGNDRVPPYVSVMQSEGITEVESERCPDRPADVARKACHVDRDQTDGQYAETGQEPPD